MVYQIPILKYTETEFYRYLPIRNKLDTIKRQRVHRYTNKPFVFFIDLLTTILFYCKNEISTPAATAEPITPEILLDIQ